MNAPMSHQNLRLSRGRHSSPEHGVCAMELASMLAGERFTDHPRSVSPLIASFMRAYNDRVDDARRQDLYALASACVGTHASVAEERRRAEICRDWLEARSSLELTERLGWLMRFARPARARLGAGAARWAALMSARHSEALELVELLCGQQEIRPDDVSRGTHSGDAPVCSTG